MYSDTVQTRPTSRAQQLPTEGKVFFLLLGDPAWWTWFVTATLLAMGLAGYSAMYLVAIAVTCLQALVFLLRERSVLAFSVQLRVAFALLISISFFPAMRWLYWIPTVGTFAMLVFGYCLLARCLALLPWNRVEPLTLDLLQRAFFSRPLLPDPSESKASGCAGGVCTIEAQVRPSGRDDRP